MKVFIPDVGETLILAKDWTFDVVNEQRNAALAVLMGKAPEKASYYYPFGTKENDDIDSERYKRFVPIDPGTYTWPAGTVLETDRVYIRKGNEAWSSVTFKTRVKGRVVRFFAKLKDVNKIEV